MDSPAGQAETIFKIPFTRKDLEIFNLRVGQARKGMRRVDSPEMELAREYGKRLFEAVFTGDVYAGFRLSSDQARLGREGAALAAAHQGCPAGFLALGIPVQPGPEPLLITRK